MCSVHLVASHSVIFYIYCPCLLHTGAKTLLYTGPHNIFNRSWQKDPLQVSLARVSCQQLGSPDIARSAQTQAATSTCHRLFACVPSPVFVIARTDRCSRPVTVCGYVLCTWVNAVSEAKNEHKNNLFHRRHSTWTYLHQCEPLVIRQIERRSHAGPVFSHRTASTLPSFLGPFHVNTNR
jgi:hypothetical protein